MRIHTKSIAACGLISSGWKTERAVWSKTCTYAKLFGIWDLRPTPHSSVDPGRFLKECVPLFFATLIRPNKDLLKLKRLKLKPNQGLNFDLWPLLCWPCSWAVYCLLNCGSSSSGSQSVVSTLLPNMGYFSAPTSLPALIVPRLPPFHLPHLIKMFIPFNCARF